MLYEHISLHILQVVVLPTECFLAHTFGHGRRSSRRVLQSLAEPEVVFSDATYWVHFWWTRLHHALDAPLIHVTVRAMLCAGLPHEQAMFGRGTSIVVAFACACSTPW